MVTTDQKTILEQLNITGACIVFDSDEGSFNFFSPIGNEYIGKIHPATACALIKKGYIKSPEKDRGAFYLTDKGIAKARGS